MATATLGTLLKEARTKAGFTQEQLAKKVKGVTAADISKAERGEGTLSQAALKEIAKATGVTQKSLLDAAKTATAKKTTTAKTTAAKKIASTTTAKKTSTTTKKATTSTAKKTAKTPASAGITMRVTATEKRLVEAYRLADTTAKKNAMSVLKGESISAIGSLLGGSGSANSIGDAVADGLSSLVGNLLNGKK